MDTGTIRLSAGKAYSDASPANFALFMNDATQYLNDQYAKKHDNKWFQKNADGTKLEAPLCEKFNEVAKGTVFENSIHVVSGHRFPDLQAHKIYGIEIKSRNEDTWKTNGGSVQETLRVEEVERIFVTFGNFGKNPVVFKSRPYEDVISNISVTHSPRYDIDMLLAENNTIFDKMGIGYDDFRKIEPDPAHEYVKYRRRNLKPGESTWWLSEEDADSISPDVIKAWDRALDQDIKIKTIAEGMVLYPAVFNADYNEYALWLLLRKGYLNHHVRDDFTAGGKAEITTRSGIVIKAPHVIEEIIICKEGIRKYFNETTKISLINFSNEKYANVIKTLPKKASAIEIWIEIVSNTIRLSDSDPTRQQIKEWLLDTFG